MPQGLAAALMEEHSKRSKTGPLSWVSGGQLGSSASIQGAGTLLLKRTVVEILQDGENVTRWDLLAMAPSGARLLKTILYTPDRRHMPVSIMQVLYKALA